MQIDREVLREVEAAMSKDMARFDHASEKAGTGMTWNELAMHREWLANCKAETASALARLRKAMEDGKDG